jgi:hypothetical protein
MGDLLGSLVQGNQKRTILCVIWGGMLQMVSEPLPSLRWGSMHKPMKAASGDAGS